MPNTKSAKKRVRQNAKSKMDNLARKSRIKTEIKKADQHIAEGDKEKAVEQCRVVFKTLDKAAKTNIIHKNKAARKKSQMAKKISRMAGGD